METRPPREVAAMSDDGGDRLIRMLYAAAGGERPVVSDGALLERFVAARDEAAFELLVRRHGPMVLGVCERVLRHRQDAEDACQATFLVLAHKAGGVRPREAVGNWLYGVAYRTALKARTAAARRRKRERLAPVAVAPALAAPEPGDDWRPLLDQELQALPDKYRAPVVLCELEGLSRKEVASRLAIPEGTLSSRLATARHLLAKRLARRGLVPAVAAAGAALVPQTAGASWPASLLNSTVQAATLIAGGQMAGRAVSPEVAALTKGVLMNMALVKLRSAAVMACVVAVAAGLGWLTYRGLAAEPPTRVALAPVAPVKGEEARKEDAAIVELQKKKLKAAEDEYAVRIERVKGGVDTTDALLDTSKRWLEAEKEVNDTRDGRLKALRAHLERVTEAEALVRERVQAGAKNSGPADMAKAEFYRYEAEIWLRKAEAEKK
jgi:RNA polymerase sigma factor (sigma-70 family)